MASMFWACVMAAAMLLVGAAVYTLRDRPGDFGMFVHVGLVVSVATATVMFLVLFLSERIGRVLYGAEAKRSLAKVVGYCLASLAILPAFAFLSYLVGSFDVAASLIHLRFACYFSPAMPLVLLLMARVTIEEIRYREHWESLDVDE
jgi:hypothetical protein